MINVYKFTTTTCGVCKMLEPQWNLMKEDLKDNPELNFVEFVMDRDTGNATVLAKKYNISKAPTIIIADSDNNVLKEITGFLPKRELKKQISQFI